MKVRIIHQKTGNSICFTIRPEWTDEELGHHLKSSTKHLGEFHPIRWTEKSKYDKQAY